MSNLRTLIYPIPPSQLPSHLYIIMIQYIHLHTSREHAPCRWWSVAHIIIVFRNFHMRFSNLLIQMFMQFLNIFSEANIVLFTSFRIDYFDVSFIVQLPAASAMMIHIIFNDPKLIVIVIIPHRNVNIKRDMK